MTAQISISNRKGVALASDSASTTDNKKVFTSSQKIFRLSLHEPVGIMTYNFAEVNSIPTETIIKVYRKQLGDKSFPRLEDYMKDFLNFLDNGNPMIDLASQEELVEYSLQNVVKQIAQRAKLQLQQKKEEPNHNNLTKQIGNEISVESKNWEKEKFMHRMDENFLGYFKKTYKDALERRIKITLKEYNLSKEKIEDIKTIMGYYFSKYPIRNNLYTGVAVAGYGEEEHFPSVSIVKIQGVVADRLKFNLFKTRSINTKMKSEIVPFAQSDMVYLFMNGIHPNYKKFVTNYMNIIENGLHKKDLNLESTTKHSPTAIKTIKGEMEKILHEKFENFRKDLSIYEKENYSNSIINTVVTLPKNEAVRMAKALVDLTSLKRRVSAGVETVGGTTHVAYISKGDGFEWIRKRNDNKKS